MISKQSAFKSMQMRFYNGSSLKGLSLYKGCPQIQRLIIYLCVLFLFSVNPSTAANNFFLDHARGWHWYEIIETEEVQKESPEPDQNASSNPIETLKIWQQQLEVAKARAVLEPTETNVREYIVAQNEVAKKSSLFSNQWQKVLWKYPELDYSLIKPTGLLAKQAYLDTRKTNLNNTAKSFAKTHGLWFFYRSDCPYCHRFTPIVKRFAAKLGFNLIPISTDGGIMTDFPDTKIDSGQAEKLGVQVVPALFAVNPRTKEIIPISHGLLSENELLERVSALNEPRTTSYEPPL